MNEKSSILSHFKGIIDSTLREGFQFSRADFTVEDQFRIFDYLAGIGVDYIEVGNPAAPGIRTMIAALTARRSAAGPRILSHIRNNEEDVEAAAACGVHGVNILCTADGERIRSMGLSRKQYLDRLERGMERARRQGLEIRISVEDYFSRPAEPCYEIFRLAEARGAQRAAVADTLGKALSWEVIRRIRELRRRLSIDLEVHFHNDLGHAVSNSMAALRAGANWISTSLLGIGERTGITPLSSILVNLYLLDPGKMARRYNLGLLTEAENFISEICRIGMPTHLMTNPHNGFAHKAGIHLNALLRFGPRKYELISPALVGNRRNIIVGTPLSGRTGIDEVEEFNKKHP